jgi:hypothetical protein
VGRVPPIEKRRILWTVLEDGKRQMDLPDLFFIFFIL